MPNFSGPVPQQTPLTGKPMQPKETNASLFEPAPLPPSATNKARPKDTVHKVSSADLLQDFCHSSFFFVQTLMESMGGNDQAAPLHTTVVRERPVGLEPHMVSQTRPDAAFEMDEGEYSGPYDDRNQRSGHGKCVYKDGSWYEGEWDHNKRHGRGTMTYPKTGAVYDGEWHEGERSGHGVLRYNGGDSSYEGQWLRDLKHGYGCFRFQSGAEYTGQFFEGKMHGQGTYTYADGQVTYPARNYFWSLIVWA